jgi:alpha-tubulin suppressor-like RCC1 family protein
VKQIYNSSSISLVLFEDGALFCHVVSNSNNGELRYLISRPDNDDLWSRVKAYCSDRYEAYKYGISRDSKLLKIDPDIQEIYCGSSYIMIYKTSGELLTLPPNITWKVVMFDANIKQIACGSHHCLILTNDGHVYSFG